MNWFTRTVVEGSSTERKQELLDKDGGCEHVEKDVNLGTILRAERDSFGPVSTYLCCKACDEKATEAEGNEECFCKDCNLSVKKKDGFEWRWYDFYAPQGDEPLFICNTCAQLDKHKARVARDDADRRAEEGDAFSDDDGGLDDIGPDEDDDPDWWRCTCCGASVGGEEVGHPHPDYPANICNQCHAEKQVK